jgi:hypothetical protein
MGGMRAARSASHARAAIGGYRAGEPLLGVLGHPVPIECDEGPAQRPLAGVVNDASPALGDGLLRDTSNRLGIPTARPNGCQGHCSECVRVARGYRGGSSPRPGGGWGGALDEWARPSHHGSVPMAPGCCHHHFHSPRWTPQAVPPRICPGGGGVRLGGRVRVVAIRMTWEPTPAIRTPCARPRKATDDVIPSCPWREGDTNRAVSRGLDPSVDHCQRTLNATRLDEPFDG